MNKRLCFLFTVVTAVPVALLGQEKSQAPAAPPANPITASEKGLYSFVSNAVIGAAQKMPERCPRRYPGATCRLAHADGLGAALLDQSERRVDQHALEIAVMIGL